MFTILIFCISGGLCVNYCQEIWNCFGGWCRWSWRRDSFTTNNSQVSPLDTLQSLKFSSVQCVRPFYRLLCNMSTCDMTCVCLFQMCCSTNYCIHTHSGLWSLLSPSPLWTTCLSAQWFRSASQIWVAFTGIACRNNFINHWWLTMIFLLAFVIHFI